MKINLNNNFWPLFGIIILLGIGAIILLQHCEHREPKWDRAHQIDIAPEKEKKDSVRVVIQKQTEQVTVYRDRWHRLKDTVFVPVECEPVVTIITQKCDSALIADSLLIASQQAEIALSDTIISKQGQLILSQEDHITDLEKEVKRQKRKKVIAWITAGLAAGIGLTR